MIKVKVYLQYGNSIEKNVETSDEAMKYVNELKESLGLEKIEYSFEYTTGDVDIELKLDQKDEESEYRSFVTGVVFH